MEIKDSLQNLLDNQLDLQNAANTIRAVNHPLRTTMLEFIVAKNNQTDVTSIQKHIGVEQSVCSQHLRILRDAGVVSTKRVGKFMMYSVSANRIQHIMLNSKSLA